MYKLAAALAMFLACGAFCIIAAQGNVGSTKNAITTQRQPVKPARPFVLRKGQSLDELTRRLGTNSTEELTGGAGAQLRVAVQRDDDKAAGEAEVHDRADDVYYILEGKATLMLGGTLDAPREISPGEWRSKTVTGNQTIEVAKGDLIIVPRGTPHRRSTQGRAFSMILIKVFADSLPAAATSDAKRKRQTP